MYGLKYFIKDYFNIKLFIKNYIYVYDILVSNKELLFEY